MEHDFYINLGSECRIAEDHRQALKKAKMELQEQERHYQILQGYNKKLDEAKKVLEENSSVKGNFDFGAKCPKCEANTITLQN